MFRKTSLYFQYISSCKCIQVVSDIWAKLSLLAVDLETSGKTYRFAKEIWTQNGHLLQNDQNADTTLLHSHDDLYSALQHWQRTSLSCWSPKRKTQSTFNTFIQYTATRTENFTFMLIQEMENSLYFQYIYTVHSNTDRELHVHVYPRNRKLTLLSIHLYSTLQHWQRTSRSCWSKKRKTHSTFNTFVRTLKTHSIFNTFIQYTATRTENFTFMLIKKSGKLALLSIHLYSTLQHGQRTSRSCWSKKQKTHSTFNTFIQYTATLTENFTFMLIKKNGKLALLSIHLYSTLQHWQRTSRSCWSKKQKTHSTFNTFIQYTATLTENFTFMLIKKNGKLALLSIHLYSTLQHWQNFMLTLIQETENSLYFQYICTVHCNTDREPHVHVDSTWRNGKLTLLSIHLYSTLHHWQTFTFM